MRVTPQGYAGLTRVLLEIAEELCRAKLAVTLEGGYSLEGLRDSVKEVLLELDGVSTHQLSTRESLGQVDSVIGQVKKVHQEFWKCFG
jgi:acetoin utilization deacetylase AcuC-like enzyme